MNPYKSVMSILCKTLAAFDEDEQIPMYGFGNFDTKNHSVASFDALERPMHTLEAVLRAYDSQIAGVRLSGPTSFAPAVRKGIEIVRASGGQYHILVIIADGQVRVSTACSAQRLSSPTTMPGPVRTDRGERARPCHMCVLYTALCAVRPASASGTASDCAGFERFKHAKDGGGHRGGEPIPAEHHHGGRWRRPLGPVRPVSRG